MIVASVHGMIAVSMTALMIGTGAFTGRNPLLAWILVLAPVVVIALSMVDIAQRSRMIGYWSMTLPMLAFTVLGMLGGWGLLCLIGIIFLVWGGLMERQRAIR